MDDGTETLVARDVMGSVLVTEIDEEVDGPVSLVDRMVRRAQAGDADAFEGVYRAHVGRIHALCLRMSGDQHEAETGPPPIQWTDKCLSFSSVLHPRMESEASAAPEAQGSGRQPRSAKVGSTTAA